jgi:glycosyl transferase family 87
MGLTAFCAHRWCRASGRVPSAIAAAMVFAVFPSAICISYGQYAVPILALQVLAVVALDSNRPLLAGVLLGLALVKPQLTMLCVLGLAAGGSLAAGITAGVVAALGTLVMALVVGEAPWAVLAQSLTEAVHNAHNSQNPLPAWLAMLTGSAVSTLVVTLLGAAGAIVSARLLRQERSRLALVAVAAILAMFWSSRKHMDVPLMTLPLVLVGLDLARTWRLREVVLFSLLGLTLWAPLRDDQWTLPVVAMADTLIWLAAGWYILFGRTSQRWAGTTAFTAPAPRP